MAAEPAGEFGAAVDAFLAHSSVERGLSPRTIEAYSRDLARFADYLERAGVRRLRDMRRAHLADFARGLEGTGLGARSRARLLVSTRRLLRHLSARGALAEDPTEDVANMIHQSNPELYLFSSDYPHIEGGKDPIGRFERSLEAEREEVKVRFCSENFLRVWPDARVSV